MKPAHAWNSPKTRRPRMALNVGVPIAERVQAAAFWTRSGVEEFVEAALRAALAEAEARNGKAFPPLPSRGTSCKTHHG